MRWSRTTWSRTLLTWEPPPPRELKFYFDERATTAAVLQNSNAEILGSWVNHFNSNKPFLAEVEAAIQIIQLANELNLKQVSLEGDAYNVIMTLHDLPQFVKWRPKQKIDIYMRLLASKRFWFLIYSPRIYNACTHTITK